MKEKFVNKADITQWIDLSNYDMETGVAMQKAGRYLYVLFCCQQAVEKRLKALIVKNKQQFPPKTHDLMRLLDLAAIEMTMEQNFFLRKLTNYYIETRYPEEMKELSREGNKELSALYLKRTKEIIRCINHLLK